MVISAQHHRSVAENATGDLTNSYGVKAGYAQAILHLLADAERGLDVDSVNERWSQPIEFQLGQAKITARIEDAASKINLAAMVDDKGAPNDAVVDELKRLLRASGHAEDVALRVLDYQDTDTKGDFEAGARNARLTSLDELARIDGVEHEVLYGGDARAGILKHLTLWPHEAPQGSPSGQINVNTAPVEVLQTLDDDMTPQLASEIAAHRMRRAADGSPDHFKAVGDLANVQGMTQKLLSVITSRCTVKSPAFEIRVTSAVAAVEKRWLYVVTRAAAQGQGKPTVTLASHQRETEARSVKAPEVKDE